MLTHYTKTAKALSNILKHGFAWIPNRRRLTDVLVPELHDPTKRELQQFGMVSFTELGLPEADEHRKNFGSFGILVSDEWAAANGAQRVLYVDSVGPVARALRAVFKIGYADVTGKIMFPDDAGWTDAYHNKWVASMVAASPLWAWLLQVYEYLEPAKYASQREWRIVNPNPDYGLSEDKRVAIAQVSPPKNWAKVINLLPISRDSVRALVCNPADLSDLHAALPHGYDDIPIHRIAGE